MSLTDIYQRIAPAIVAFIEPLVPAHSTPGPPPLPHIFGTGFFVRADGIVATNRHVIEDFLGDWTDAVTGHPKIAVLVFHYGVTETGQHYARWVRVDIQQLIPIEGYTPSGAWFGEESPDLAFVRLRVKGVSTLALATEPSYVRVGSEIATAGFPLGNTPLTLFRSLNQISPFLRSGIVSSIYPFDNPRPHGFTIDVLQQGGSSGSPVFRVDDGSVVGMMSSSVLDYQLASNQSGLTLSVPANTNISICVPSEQIHDALRQAVPEDFPLSENFPTLDALASAVPIQNASVWEGLNAI
jgi:S1-C subfamily serine protease